MEKTETNQERKTVTKSEFARLYGCSAPYISKLLSKGIIQETDDGRIDVAAAFAAIRQNEDPARDGLRRQTETQNAPQSNGDSQKNVKYATARARREESLAELAEITLMKELKILVPGSESEKVAFELGKIISEGMLNISPRLSPQLAPETDVAKIHAMLDGEIRKVLHEFAISLKRHFAGSESSGEEIIH